MKNESMYKTKQVYMVTHSCRCAIVSMEVVNFLLASECSRGNNLVVYSSHSFLQVLKKHALCCKPTIPHHVRK